MMSDENFIESVDAFLGTQRNLAGDEEITMFTQLMGSNPFTELTGSTFDSEWGCDNVGRCVIARWSRWQLVIPAPASPAFEIQTDDDVELFLSSVGQVSFRLPAGLEEADWRWNAAAGGFSGGLKTSFVQIVHALGESGFGPPRIVLPWADWSYWDVDRLQKSAGDPQYAELEAAQRRLLAHSVSAMEDRLGRPLVENRADYLSPGSTKRIWDRMDSQDKHRWVGPFDEIFEANFSASTVSTAGEIDLHVWTNWTEEDSEEFAWLARARGLRATWSQDEAAGLVRFDIS
jgi:hypothetical protein